MAMPADVRVGASVDIRDRLVTMADGVGCPATSIANIGGPGVDRPRSRGYGDYVGGSDVGVRAVACPRRSPTGRPNKGVGADGPRRGCDSTPGGCLPAAAAGDGGTMARGLPGRIDGLVCTKPTTGPMGWHGHHSGPHAIAGGGGCALPWKAGGHDGGLVERCDGGLGGR